MERWFPFDRARTFVAILHAYRGVAQTVRTTDSVLKMPGVLGIKSLLLIGRPRVDSEPALFPASAAIVLGRLLSAASALPTRDVHAPATLTAKWIDVV